MQGWPVGVPSAAQGTTGERCGAESAGDRRPSNLIWVMPAQGVGSTSREAALEAAPPVLFPRTESTMTSTSTSTTRTAQADVDRSRWRTVDIVVAAVIAVAFGVVFWAWNLLWTATGRRLHRPPAAAGLHVRRLAAARRARRAGHPQAGRGGLHRAGRRDRLRPARQPVGRHGRLLRACSRASRAELVFLPPATARWGLPTAVLAGAAAGVAAVRPRPRRTGTPDWALGWMTYVRRAGRRPAPPSIAGAGGWLLVRALARTGVLAPFASGREQRAV